MPISGPVLENEPPMKPLSRREKQICYVDDLNPILTTHEEFYILDNCLTLFEEASGCQFHRDPTSQKCKVMPLCAWKQWLTSVPLPFLLVTDNADVLGVQIYEKWSETLRINGDKLVEKVK